jgi:hypothetical protein
MTVFRFRETDRNPAHIYVNLYCGPDPDHLALSGQLTFRVDEWPAFADAITDYNERVEDSVCASCGGIRPTGPLPISHRAGCKRCPRCGSARPLGRWDVCQPCAVDEGWEPAEAEVAS